MRIYILLFVCCAIYREFIDDICTNIAAFRRTGTKDYSARPNNKNNLFTQRIQKANTAFSICLMHSLFHYCIIWTIRVALCVCVVVLRAVTV